jgi:hypothetical protein
MYLEGAVELLERAEAELKGGELRQASEKIWGACALAIKALGKAPELWGERRGTSVRFGLQLIPAYYRLKKRLLALRF